MKREPLLTLLVVSNVTKGCSTEWMGEMAQECEATQNVEFLVVMDNGCRENLRQEAVSFAKGKFVAFVEEDLQCKDVDKILKAMYMNPQAKAFKSAKPRQDVVLRDLACSGKVTADLYHVLI